MKSNYTTSLNNLNKLNFYHTINAENNSDENTIIIHDAAIANIYLQEFEKRWGELSTESEAIIELGEEYLLRPSQENLNLLRGIFGSDSIKI